MYVVGYLHKKGLKVGLNKYSDKKKLEDQLTSEVRRPGEAVPEAEGWKDHVVNANLKLGWLQTEASYNESKVRYDSESDEAEQREIRKQSASGLVSEDLDDDIAEDDIETDESDLESMKRPELVALCRKNGLPVRGNKDDLIERLKEHSESLAS